MGSARDSVCFLLFNLPLLSLWASFLAPISFLKKEEKFMEQEADGVSCVVIYS